MQRNQPLLRVSRRGLLQAGGVSFGGLALAHLLRHEAEAGVSPTADKLSVILCWMPGGPSHIDMWDMKPEAPLEYRGEFQSIGTDLPGYRVCELMPNLAKMCSKLAILRSVHHTENQHSQGTHTVLTGYAPTKGDPAQEAPCCGSIIAKELGPRNGLPAYIATQQAPGHGRAGYLGVEYDPFETFGYPTSSEFRVRNLRLPRDVDDARMQRRRSMLKTVDTIRRDADASGAIASMDTFRRQAFQLATSPEVQDAFDLNQEDDATRQRYGRKSSPGQNALLARRLVERGARFVTVKSSYGRPWDSHTNNFPDHRVNVPGYDHMVSTLINDLDERGLLERTLVIVSGEFGRTPKINDKAGRDHWPGVYTTVLAGGGVKRGVVLGSSDALGERPKDRPISHQDVLATMYDLLGIDYQKSYLNEANRPVPILNYGKPIHEIL
jgi:hypothetical protein